LPRALSDVAATSRDIAALDLFTLAGESADVQATTRAPGTIPALDPGALRSLRAGSRASSRAESMPGTPPVWRVVTPLWRDGVVVGAARVDVSLAEVSALQHWLRLIDWAVLLLSTIAISLVLTLFLERRVARPVATLVDGMQRAEGGALAARVAMADRGEFGFLATRFNQMLARVEDLTAGLEARVRQATRDSRSRI
jgi:HAMP domain-containing protein